MKLIKLNAIDSTNDFLKGLSNAQTLENFTVVTAENQTRGKGQMGAKWYSEIGKNLITSILIKYILRNNSEIFQLNFAISLAICDGLNHFKIPKLSIKWPNDIMSDDKKIAGILIENSIKSDSSIVSVVGFGININQTNFESLPKASSLKNIMNQDFDKNAILDKVYDAILNRIQQIQNKSENQLFKEYNDKLFKKRIMMPFENNENKKFMGIIQGVSQQGKLQIILENDEVREYDVKEISMLY
jgi:BirA family transcriptional regulator, biotin operon repressor / biotin---[acetyl-CoA-carboxylase] ligase